MLLEAPLTSASGRDEGTPEWSCHLQLWGGVGSCSNSRDGFVLGPSGLVVPRDQVADANLWRESVRRLAVVEDPPYAIDPRQGVAFDVDQERAAVCGHGDRRDEARAAHLLRTGRRPQQTPQRCWFAYIPTALQPSAFEDVGRCGQDQWCSRRQRRCLAPVQSCSAHGEPLVDGRIQPVSLAMSAAEIATSYRYADGNNLSLSSIRDRLFAQFAAAFGLLGPRSRAGWIAFCSGDWSRRDLTRITAKGVAGLRRCCAAAGGSCVPLACSPELTCGDAFVVTQDRPVLPRGQAFGCPDDHSGSPLGYADLV